MCSSDLFLAICAPLNDKGALLVSEELLGICLVLYVFLINQISLGMCHRLLPTADAPGDAALTLPKTYF
mgnify:CR=1 FL=1